MAQPLVALFWFAVGAAYLSFGWVNWVSVRFLYTVQGNAVKKLEDAIKRAIIEETRPASHSPEEMQIETWEAAAERKVQELLADPEVTTLAVNQKVLRMGALSFFFAGAISFVQGLFLLAGW
jgi:hypothetical protein